MTLAPGRASDATRPAPIGSPTEANTTAIDDVAFFTATVVGVATNQVTADGQAAMLAFASARIKDRRIFGINVLRMSPSDSVVKLRKIFKGRAPVSG